MGKKGFRSAEWADVTVSYEDGKHNPLVSCNYCQKSWTNSSVKRIRSHMLTCKRLPEEQWALYDRDEGEEEDGPPKKRQTRLPTELYTMTAEDQKACNMLLAEAIYSAGIPFSFVENPAFRRFLQRLRPAYQPPARKSIASDLLDEVYKDTNQKMQKVLQKAGRQITLVSDGWTNLRGEAIVNYVAVTRKHAIFLKSTPTGSDRHTGPYIAQEIAKIVEELRPVNIVAITMDNASNMRAAQALLGQQYSQVLMLGCASHIVNLTVGDLFELPALNNLFRIVMEVVKYFKFLYILVGLLNSTAERLGRKRKALQLPGNTRWQGKLNTTDAIVDNRQLMEIIVQEPETALPDRPTKEQKAKFNRIRKIILSYRFWEQVDALQKFLRPFLEVTITLKGVQPKASRIFAYFRYLA